MKVMINEIIRKKKWKISKRVIWEKKHINCFVRRVGIRKKKLKQ